MPSVELLGYGEEEGRKLEAALRDNLADLDFCNEIVFIHFQSTISGFRGDRQSYIRVCTRNEDKARILMDRLKRFADVEFIRAAGLVMKTN